MIAQDKPKEKIVIFGASTGGKRAYDCRHRTQAVVAFADNDPTKQGKHFYGIQVIAPQKINDISYDRIVIACHSSFQVYLQLNRLGVDSKKVSVLDEDVLLGDYEISTFHFVLLLAAVYGAFRLVIDGISLAAAFVF